MRAVYPCVLASISPRRAELLKQILDDFQIIPPNYQECLPPEGDPDKVATQTAVHKAESVFQLHPDCLVIGADTIIAHDGLLLGKPASRQEAVESLQMLSGRTHEVVTGVSLFWPGNGSMSFAEKSLVTFKELDSTMIFNYVETKEAMDKAGAYAVQGGAAQFVDRVEGDIDIVIGLPLARLILVLQSCNLFRKFSKI